MEESIAELISARKYRQALEILKDDLILAPNDWYANYLAGVALRFLGDFGQAIVHLTAATKSRPHDDAICLALGIAYQLSGQMEESILALKKAIQIQENLIEAYNSLGLTYRKLERFQDALEWYDMDVGRLIKLVSATIDEDPSRCYIDGGTTLKILPYFFERARDILRSNILYAVLSNNMGCCYTSLGDLESARAAFEEAIEFTPDGYDYPDPVRHLNDLESDSKLMSLKINALRAFRRGIGRPSRQRERLGIPAVFREPSNWRRVEGCP